MRKHTDGQVLKLEADRYLFVTAFSLVELVVSQILFRCKKAPYNHFFSISALKFTVYAHFLSSKVLTQIQLSFYGT